MENLLGENLINMAEAMKIMKLSRPQIIKLCTKGRIKAQKVSNVWIIDRASAENYKPDPRGFAVVWQRRREQQANSNNSPQK